MKPEILTLHNIGPFVGEQKINFNSLDDFFLISGKTGSGKTTILDSITYVLYGSLPGARKNIDTKNLRTDFCDEQELSFVDLIFSINSKYYRVKRTLPFIYKTRNNTTRKEAETTEFYTLKNLQDSQGELISNQKSEADKSIKELLQLNVEEFSKIVLLPQGEFATFLRQSTKERQEMLSKLFPVENFTQITQNAKEEKNKLETQLEQITKQQEFISKDFKLENYENDFTNLNTKLNTNKEIIKETQNRLFEVAGTIEKLQNELKNQIEYENLKAQLEEINLSKNIIEEKKEKVTKAKKVLELYPIIKNIEQKENKIKDLEKEIELCQKDITTLLEKENELKQKENEILKTENKIKNLEIKKNEIEKSFNFVNDLNDNIKELNSKNEKIYNLENSLSEVNNLLNTLVNETNQDKIKINEKEILIKQNYELNDKLEILNNNEKYLEEEKQFNTKQEKENEIKNTLDQLQKTITDLKSEIEKEKQNELSFLLAKELKENQPCPVCGSLSHPSPIKEIKKNISSTETLSLQENLLKEKELQYQQISKEKNISEGILLNLKPQINLSIKENKNEIHLLLEETKNKINKIELIEKNLINKENEIENYKNKSSQLSESLNKEKNNLAILNERITTIKNNLINNFSFTEDTFINIKDVHKKLQLELETTNQNLVTFKNDIESFYTNQKEISNLISGKNEKNILLKNNLQETNKEINLEKENLENKLINSTLQNIQEVKENYLDEKEILNLENSIEEWNNEKNRLSTLIKEKENLSVKSREELDNKLIKYTDESQNLNEKLDSLNSENTELNKKIFEIKTLKENFEKTEKQRKEISEKLTDYTKLYKVLSGNNKKKIEITSWILEMYLQEIISFANLRLNKISEGRYIMKVNTEKESNRGAKGLDIDVFDSFTGKSRPCNTLSGGETFMASISLALAISDTVQTKKGGIQLESLFIDEGFGSLDENSLEKAISILDEIRDSRIIGIISHVGELKTRIKSSIEIEKTTSGSKIILI